MYWEYGDMLWRCSGLLHPHIGVSVNETYIPHNLVVLFITIHFSVFKSWSIYKTEGLTVNGSPGVHPKFFIEDVI